MIRRNAEKKWKDDYEMVEYEMKKQTEAFRELLRHRADKSLGTIVAKAEAHWKEDYQMVVYEIKKQRDARARINAR